MTLEALNAMDQPTFTNAVGWVFEHSPWVVERAWSLRPFDDAWALHRAFIRVLSEAVLAVGGQPLQPVQWWLDGPSGATFVSVAPGFGTMIHDPTAQVRRQREPVEPLQLRMPRSCNTACAGRPPRRAADPADSGRA